MKRALTLLAGLGLLVAGCPQFSQGARYHCDPQNACPGGSTCVNNFCVAQADGGQPGTDGGHAGSDCTGGTGCDGFANSFCHQGYCLVQCGQNANCAPDEICDTTSGSPVCQKADGVPCGGDSDCPVHFKCANGPTGNICRRLCLDVSGCPEGWKCDPLGGQQACMPAECGAGAQGMTAAFGATDACTLQTGVNEVNGTCVGPEPQTYLADQDDGLCYGDGKLQEGVACGSGALYGDGSQACAAGLACVPPLPLLTNGGNPPSGPATCRTLCGAGAGPCPQGSRCWQLWANLGVCVKQQAGVLQGQPGNACGSAITVTHAADNRTCIDGVICVPSSVGATGGTCYQACNTGTSHNPVVCPGGATCTAVPGNTRVPNLGYCKP